MARINCIDVSTWQGNIDWAKVKAAGFSHAILRAGFGRSASQIDNKFEQNYTNAKKAGVKLGVYWYSYAIDRADAVKEANACLAVLKNKKLEMPVYFDMEEASMTTLGKATLTSMARAFCDTIIKGGFRAGVYSNPNWFKNYLDYNALRKSYSIWLAQWSATYQYDCDVWQYSSEGKVSGISGNVDMNYIIDESIVRDVTQPTPTTPTTPVITVFETAAVQALLRQAYAYGIAKTYVTPIDNLKGKLTNAAIVESKTYLGYKTINNKISLDFIKDLEAEIEKKRLESELSARADANGDGKVDIRDATYIQEMLAGLG